MFKVQVVKDMRCHIESGHKFMLAKKIKEKQQQQTILACNPRESFPDQTNNFPHVLMSGEIDVATKCVGRYEKNNNNKKKSLFTLISHPNHSIIHAVPYFMVGIISGPGSFAVQFGDHLRSGIICGPGNLRSRTDTRSGEQECNPCCLVQNRCQESVGNSNDLPNTIGKPVKTSLQRIKLQIPSVCSTLK